MKQKLLRAAVVAAALFFWGLVWHLVATRVNLSFILPRPLEVLEKLWQLCLTKDFYQILLTSFFRISLGFLGGVFLGFLFGTAAHFLLPFRALVSPLMAMVRATPVASFILVVILWIEKDQVPAFISVLMVLPIVWQNTLLGFESRDPALSEVATVFRFGGMKTLCRVDLPQVIPYVVSASRTSLGLAWKAGVAAEVLALPKVSVGMMIYNAKLYLETVDLYAWTLAIILVSVLLEKTMVFLLKNRKRRGA